MRFKVYIYLMGNLSADSKNICITMLLIPFIFFSNRDRKKICMMEVSIVDAITSNAFAIHFSSIRSTFKEIYYFFLGCMYVSFLD